MRLLVCFLLCAVASVLLLTQGARAEPDPQDSDSAISSDRDGKLFFKFVVRSTTTSFSVVRSTTTVPYTCISAASTTAVCAGRRKRRRRRTLNKPEEESLSAAGEVPAIQSSIGDHRENTDTSLKKEDRLIITSWSTRLTTFTSVSTVTTFGSTVSISVLCTLGGISQFPNC
ncbi:uncharacterized protein LOC122369560 isoform X2 [Amphibalanus amphitrite]|uniref:uncharacterized protein LOC122369560 isoform X2 n=1 Tax=Amphibalanus amphitrite TaxID=1232801 RepID=UPI001C8FE488|nr:uncharacterized protein LOC122369560 isoform X2 [Amphibalanus amphitrite]